MSAGADIFNDTLFLPVDFSKPMEGIVVGNDHFEKDLYLDVFIRELFVDEVPMLSSDKRLLVNTSNRTLAKNLIVSTKEDGTVVRASETGGFRTDLSVLIDDINNKLATKYYKNDVLTTAYNDLRALLTQASSMVEDNLMDNDDPNFSLMISSLREAENGLQLKTVKDTINTSKILNASDLDFDANIEVINYLKCYPKVISQYDPKKFDDLPDEMKAYYKPPVGSKITVEFLHGDPKLPYYTNKFPHSFDINIIPDYVGHTGSDLYSNEALLRAPAKEDEYTLQGYHRLLKHTTPYMRGGDVYRLHTKLKALGYVFSSVAPVNEYAEEMQAIVTQYQTSHGITADKLGTVGPITYDAIMDDADQHNGEYAAYYDLANDLWDVNHKSDSSRINYVQTTSNVKDALYYHTIELIKQYDIIDYEVYNSAYDNIINPIKKLYIDAEDYKAHAGYIPQMNSVGISVNKSYLSQTDRILNQNPDQPVIKQTVNHITSPLTEWSKLQANREAGNNKTTDSGSYSITTYENKAIEQEITGVSVQAKDSSVYDGTSSLTSIDKLLSTSNFMVTPNNLMDSLSTSKLALATSLLATPVSTLTDAKDLSASVSANDPNEITAILDSYYLHTKKALPDLPEKTQHILDSLWNYYNIAFIPDDQRRKYNYPSPSYSISRDEGYLDRMAFDSASFVWAVLRDAQVNPPGTDAWRPSDLAKYDGVNNYLRKVEELTRDDVIYTLSKSENILPGDIFVTSNLSDNQPNFMGIVTGIGKDLGGIWWSPVSTPSIEGFYRNRTAFMNQFIGYGNADSKLVFYRLNEHPKQEVVDLATNTDSVTTESTITDLSNKVAVLSQQIEDLQATINALKK